MEEYFGLDLEEFGLYLRYPSWWLHRMEGEETYVFQDEYVGILRLTPRKFKVGEAEHHYAQACKAHPGGRVCKFRRQSYYRYDEAAITQDGVPVCIIGFIGLIDRVLIESTFSYPQVLLDDEFKAEGVEATLEEVTILLDSIGSGDDDD